MTKPGDDNRTPFGRGGSRNSGPIVPVSPSQALKPEQAPPPPRRSRRAKSQVVIFLNFMLSLVIFVAIAGVAIFWYGKTEFEKAGPLDRNTTYMVRDGASIAEIAAGLERSGIITDQRVFRYGSRTRLGDDTLKAGEYEIKARASMQDILELMRSGKAILHAFTIPEGQTTAQVIARLRADEILEGDLPEELPAEGAILPETYKFGRGTTRAELLDQMVKAQTRALEQVWQRRDPNLAIKSKEDLVTLASIVEKETGKADERPRVAAVFLNRLEKGMRLQSDPTVIYGIFGGEGKPSDRPIYKSDLEKETPYNTYAIKGLPPGPIANPGREAMEAVANPSRTNELYFVADGTGGHAFAETLDDHNANVARWRKIEKEREAEAKAAEEAQKAAPQ